MQLEHEAHHHVVDGEAQRRLHVGPEQPEQRGGVHLRQLARDDQPQQVGLLEDLEQAATRRGGDQVGLHLPQLLAAASSASTTGIASAWLRIIRRARLPAFLRRLASPLSSACVALVGCPHLGSSAESAKVFSHRWGEVISPSWSR